MDELVDYGDSSKHLESIFDFKINHFKPWPFDNNYHTVFTIQLDRDKATLERKVYTFLDLVTEVGGFAKGMMGILLVTIAVFGTKSLKSEIVRDLFDLPPDDPSEKCKCFKQSNFYGIVNKCKKKKDLRELKFERAQKMLNHEANLIDILQQLRYVQSGLNHLISPDVKAELWQKSKLRHIPSEDDDDGFNSEEEIKSSKIKHLDEFDDL